MAEPVIIRTSIDRARILGRVLDSAQDGSSIGNMGQPPTGLRSSVVVEIIEDIAEDDFEPHAAKLLELVGDAWIDTLQTLPVRNLSFSAIGAETRIIAECVSRWGWCVRTGGGGDKSIWGTIYEVVCDPYGDATETYCWVAVTDYSGGCTALPSGAVVDEYSEYYGMVQVFQKCDIFTAYYTTEQLIGKTIEAGYYYPRTGYCEPKWIVRQVCGQPECA